MKPRYNRVLVQPRLVTEVFAKELLDKTGLELANPPRQGVPSLGLVVAIGQDVDHSDFDVDDLVFFHEPKPHGFDSAGRTLFSIKPETIKAKLV